MVGSVVGRWRIDIIRTRDGFLYGAVVGGGCMYALMICMDGQDGAREPGLFGVR